MIFRNVYSLLREDKIIKNGSNTNYEKIITNRYKRKELFKPDNFFFIFYFYYYLFKPVKSKKFSIILSPTFSILGGTTNDDDCSSFEFNNFFLKHSSIQVVLAFSISQMTIFLNGSKLSIPTFSAIP